MFINIFRGLIVLASAMLFTTVNSASAVEYGLMLSNPQYGTGTHSGCNQLLNTKSQLNKKSLNPMCNLCLGDDGSAAHSSWYGAVPIAPGIATFCFSIQTDENGTPVPLSAGLYSDWSTLCTSRGGTAVDLDGAFMCALGFDPNPTPTPAP